MGRQISQRDLRRHSKRIIDAVEHGESFIVTRDGRSIGKLAPMPRRRAFISRSEFAAHSRTSPILDHVALRTDQDEASNQEPSDPYER